MSLIVLADLKTRLEITSDEYDTVLANIILAAEKFVARRLLKRTIIETPDGEGEEEGVTETHNGDGGDTLYTREYPIQEVLELKVNDEVIPARESVTGCGYVVADANFGVIRLDGYVFIQGIQNVDLNHVAGWAAGEVPDEIVEAAYRIASALWNQKQLVGIENQSVETLQQKMTAVIDQTTRDLVAPFIRPQI